MACLAAQKARRAIRKHEAFLCACMASPGAPGAPGAACGVQRQAHAAGAGSARALVPAYIPAPSPHAHCHGQTLARNFRAAPTPPAPQDTGAATGASARMATYGLLGHRGRLGLGPAGQMGACPGRIRTQAPAPGPISLAMEGVRPRPARKLAASARQPEHQPQGPQPPQPGPAWLRLVGLFEGRAYKHGVHAIVYEIICIQCNVLTGHYSHSTHIPFAQHSHHHSHSTHILFTQHSHPIRTARTSHSHSTHTTIRTHTSCTQ